MGEIIILDEGTANRIAAGEVVERPASVVKELVENSLDAGAKKIEVDIKKGGIASISVSDDGEGFYGDDVAMAFERHATSKLRTAADLERITTLGFRGEALPSIASVSKVRLSTRRRDDEIGRLVELHAGAPVRDEQAGCRYGTTIIVSELFYNTPARYKFLKKDTSEAAQISELVGRLAIGRPDVSFTLTSQNAVIVHTPGGGNPDEAVFAVLGSEIFSGLSPIRADTSDIRYSVTGYAGKPETARANRNYQLFYVNGRLIKNRVIYSAVEEAYKSHLTVRRYPVAVLFIAADASLVDVNAHPAKTEVRFQNDGDLFRAVYRAVDSALGGMGIQEAKTGFYHNTKKEIWPAPLYTPYREDYSTAPADAPPTTVCDIYSGDTDAGRDGTQLRRVEISPAAAAAFEAAPADVVGDVGTGVTAATPGIPYTGRLPADIFAELMPPYADPGPAPAAVFEPASDDAVSKPTPVAVFEPASDDAVSTPAPALFQARYIGQVFNTYLAFEDGNAFILVDQHAAHERMLYERIKRQYESGTIARQVLLEPVAVNLLPDEMLFVHEVRTYLLSSGFFIEDFGREAVIIREAPVYMERTDVGGFFLDTLETLRRVVKLGKRSGEDAVSYDAALYEIACKAAVKGNRRLSADEAVEMYAALDALPKPLTCPHGRPLVVSVPRRDLEKMFRRIQ